MKVTVHIPDEFIDTILADPLSLEFDERAGIEHSIRRRFRAEY